MVNKLVRQSHAQNALKSSPCREVWQSPFWSCGAVGEEVDLFGGVPHEEF